MITEGYSRYACDVQGCAESAFALPHTDAADGYVLRRRIDAEGMERKLLICPAHAVAYAEIVRACDAAYAEFEKTGRASLATQAQLAEAEARAEERDKAAKWWSDKHKALQAEFDAYRAAHPEGGDA